MAEAPDGVIVVDKPAGMTSHDVVDVVRRRLGTKKVGHGGTLDPDATGILVIGVGRTTRFLSYSASAPKRYEAAAAFGITTTTQDASGEVVAVRPATVTRAGLDRALEPLVGGIEQIPPMVSAVKVGGERLYRKALRGEEIDRPVRRVTIHRIAITDFDPGAQTAALDVVCSAGTYVRTLVHDLGESLGCGAHLTRLRRIEAGGFTIDDAVTLEAVGPGCLRPMLDAVRALTALEVSPAEAHLVSSGRPLDAPGNVAEDDPVALTSAGRLIAVYRREGARLVADRVVGA